MDNLIKKLQALQKFLTDGVYDVVCVEAENFYRKTFDMEGFTDRGFRKWDNVQRKLRPARTKSEKTLAGRPILTESGDLKKSVHAEKKPPYVIIHADREYAQVHNEGGMSGRTGRQFVMKQRQFIGKSAALNERITSGITRRIKNLK
ncbi:MAG: phage virion morphogenesis protein [Bacteroidales bacterium]|jgi:phage gpG-like protein|nr:phage virion morphogenesis protein [Bacteroidales bacterium]